MRKFSKVLSLLLVFAMIIPGFAQAAPVATGAEVTRLAGAARWETAARVSKEAFEEGSDYVVIASGRDFGDALAGSSLAAAYDAPILLTKENELPAATKAEISRLDAKKAIILGGTSVVTAEVEKEIAALGVEVEARLGGANRYDTAALIAERVLAETNATTAVVVSGKAYADGMTVGAYAGLEGYPVLYTREGSLPTETAKALEAVENVILVGGTAVISEAVKAELDKTHTVEALRADHRTETAMEIARKFKDSKKVIIANGWDYADALVASALGVKNNAPILLVKTNEIRDSVKKFITSGEFEEAYVIGGTNSVNNNTLAKVEEALKGGSEITEDHKLRVTPTAKVVQANGADNTVVKFELLNAEGKVDENADNMVLEIGTTFGNLANSRVTIQDGVGQVVLMSEFSTKEIVAKITAQVIEASEEYKHLIGRINGEATVTFQPAGATTDPNAVTFQDAESNQADRVVLYFDKAVSPATFVKMNEDGTFKTTVDKKAQILKDDVEIEISQDEKVKSVVGIRPVAGNDKAVEVLIATENKGYLIDNAKVKLDVKVGTTRNQKEFTLTDARQPEFTAATVKNLKTLNLKFSESWSEGKFTIDGILDGVIGKEAGNNEFQVIPGKFDTVTGVDRRDTATVVLGTVNGDQNYFTAGQHSITVNQLKDWAGQKDPANVSSSQTLNFQVVANNALPTAKVTVESPEQFRVTFNEDVDAILKDIAGETKEEKLNKLFNDAFKFYDDEGKTWTNVSANNNGVFNANDQLLVVEKTAENNEYVVELTRDWTKLMVKNKDVYYNYRYQLEFAKDSFVNLSNGKGNAKFTLDLNYVNSPLNTADNKSPEIADIRATLNDSIYTVVMNEPVKLNNDKDNTLSKDNAGATLAVGQTALPEVQAEFQGKNASGKSVVIPATVGSYVDLNKADMRFSVATSEENALQALVNAGYDENWTVVVRSISDDIGNTASTLTKDFVIKSNVEETGFRIESSENNYTNRVYAFDADKEGKDRLEITFTKSVNVAGAHNLTSTANWTLNGKNLSTLSNVESIKVTNGNAKDGYKTVVITFKDHTAFGSTSNVIAVNRNIESLDGTILSGAYEVVAETILSGVVNKIELDKAKAEAADLEKTDYTAETWAKLETALNLPEATQIEVDEKVAEIRTAIAELAPVEGKIIVNATEGVTLFGITVYEIELTNATYGDVEKVTAGDTDVTPETGKYEDTAKSFMINSTSGVVKDIKLVINGVTVNAIIKSK